MLEKEYDYFVSVRDRLVKEHRGEYVIIKDNETIGFYPSENAAITAMTGNELGTFLVQQCIPEDESIQKYHSRAIFA